MGIVDGVRTKGRLVDLYINTAYDIVKNVSDNIPLITNVETFISSGDAADILTAQADTAADAIATAADLVLTNADVVLTAADVVTTNADAVLTAADLVSVQSLYDQFDDRFLGPKAADPTLDNDSNALIEGSMYWNTVSKEMRVWNGAAFVVSYNALTGISDSATAIALTIDSNENVGIGNQSLETWSLGTALQIGPTSTILGDTSSTHLLQNAYFDASWKHQTTAAASTIELANGHIALGVIASGTEDTAISWTYALYITDAGILNLGNSSIVKDEDDMNSDSASHLVSQQSVKAYVDAVQNPVSPTGFIGGIETHIEDDVGAVSTSLDVPTALTIATWESVGPTSSGADNIWTGMDDIPANATAVILKIYNRIIGSSTGNSYKGYLWGRKTGSVVAQSVVTQIALDTFTNRSGSSQEASSMCTAYLPLDASNRFDLQYDSSGTTPTSDITIMVIGWII